jgi:energy-coupling factor transporter ATP-binding protein EcfA2
VSKNRKKEMENENNGKIKTYLDMIAPAVVKFNTDHYICGNTFRCVYALREYPTSTQEQAILRHLGEKDGVTLRIYTRQVTAAEEKRIIHNATNKNRMKTQSTNDLQQTVTAQSNLQDVVTMVSTMHRNREPLLHCAVYIELTASDYDSLKLLQTDVLTELVRSKLNVDRLLLRQQQGFRCVGPSGRNVFGNQYERVLPASSAANLYPFNYSGKTDSHGFYLGRDKFGSNILVDFDKRDNDKTNPCILILGNSGQGKSYLLKLILCNILESGKKVIVLDPEHEFAELADNLGGCFIDLMSGEYMINPLEPKSWDDGGSPQDKDAPVAFRQATKLSQHISFLKDFFRCYKDFTDRHIDVIEIMLSKLYTKWHISDSTDFTALQAENYPILSDLYALIESEYKGYDTEKYQLYTAELLQEILLGLHSMCMGAESKFFNGHTNVTSDRFIVFGVKGLLQASKNVKNALLFNVLSFMSDKLLTEGNTAAAIDELYLFLTNLTAIEYIRNFMKRVRKKESSVILSSQNLEDFNIEGIREMTKPLFSIPTHQFLFNAGAVDAKFYMDTLQLEESEYKLIRFPQKGVCLYKCGNERYNLAVHAPGYKEKLFGKAGGR